MYEFFQPFEDVKVIATVALFAPNETIKIQQCKYQKIQHLNVAQILNIIVACSSDGRIKVFINEKYDGKINEDEDEFDDL